MPDRIISGGDRLEAALRKIATGLKVKTTLQVGFLAGATYPKTGTSIPMVAAIQEFGAPRRGIPPRPFFRPAVKKYSSEWPDQIADQLKKTDFDATKTLNRMGALIRGEIQESIRDVETPALSPVTLMVREIVGPNGTPTFKDVLEARKRVAAGERASGISTKPLIWTSTMLNKVDWRIKE